MPLGLASTVQVLNDKDFQASRTKQGTIFTLYPAGLKGRFIVCLFAKWERTPVPVIDAAYAAFKEAASSISPSHCVFSVLDVVKYPNVTTLSRNTRTPVTGIPKLMIFRGDGLVVGIFPQNLPRTAQNIGKFVMSYIEAHSVREAPGSHRTSSSARQGEGSSARQGEGRGRSTRSRAREEDYEDEDLEEEEEDLEEEEETPRSSRRGNRSGRNTFEPDFGSIPQIGRYTRGQTIDQEDGEEFLIPEDITPHNRPWLHSEGGGDDDY